MEEDGGKLLLNIIMNLQTQVMMEGIINCVIGYSR